MNSNNKEMDDNSFEKKQNIINGNNTDPIEVPKDIVDPNWLGFRIWEFKAFLRRILKGRLGKS